METQHLPDVTLDVTTTPSMNAPRPDLPDNHKSPQYPLLMLVLANLNILLNIAFHAVNLTAALASNLAMAHVTDSQLSFQGLLI